MAGSKRLKSPKPHDKNHGFGEGLVGFGGVWGGFLGSHIVGVFNALMIHRAQAIDEGLLHDTDFSQRDRRFIEQSVFELRRHDAVHNGGDGGFVGLFKASGGSLAGISHHHDSRFFALRIRTGISVGTGVHFSIGICLARHGVEIFGGAFAVVLSNEIANGFRQFSL